MSSYIGRFAPSPTGPLHFGSLITAIASYCDAKAHDGQWLIRIEDTDFPRHPPAVTQHILQTLHAFGLHSDQAVLQQSQHIYNYEQVLNSLWQQQQIYGCACSRKMLNSNLIYPHTCRHLQLPATHNAIRLKVPNHHLIAFNDLRLGNFKEDIAATVGDFVLKRRDGILSYQLCVVVDDAKQQVTHVVRGLDLLDNTSRQIYLQQVLGYPIPQYLHLPLAKNQFGQKLSKQNLAMPLNLSKAPNLLLDALRVLGQPFNPYHNVNDILKHAVAHWQRQLIPNEIDGIYT